MKNTVKFLVPLMLVLLMLASVSVKAESLKTDAVPVLSDGINIIDTLFNFDSQKPGGISDGWTNESGKWLVKKDGNNMVLAQKAENRGSKFNVSVYKGALLRDVDMTVSVRAISGREDQGGGLVWRYTDIKNYYIVRFNPLEDNFRLYKVYNGRRIQLVSANAKVTKGAWFKVRVVMKGNEITCYLDGEKLITKKDDTFTRIGKTGFWTKADAVSDFDNFSLKGK